LKSQFSGNLADGLLGRDADPILPGLAVERPRGGRDTDSGGVGDRPQRDATGCGLRQCVVVTHAKPSRSRNELAQTIVQLVRKV